MLLFKLAFLNSRFSWVFCIIALIHSCLLLEKTLESRPDKLHLLLEVTKQVTQGLVCSGCLQWYHCLFSILISKDSVLCSVISSRYLILRPTITMCFPWAGAFTEIFVNFSNRNSFMEGRSTNTDFLLNSNLVIRE